MGRIGSRASPARCVPCVAVNGKDGSITQRQRNVLAQYSEWLNQFGGPGSFVYTIQNWDPEHNEYAVVEQLAAYNFYDEVEVYLVADGDEGGGAVLTAWFERTRGPSNTPNRITQEFDSKLSVVMEEGQLATFEDNEVES